MKTKKLSILLFVRSLVNCLIAFAIFCLFVPFASAVTIEQWYTSNRVPVFFVQANEIPIIDIRVDFDAGERFDEPNKLGIAALVNESMNKGVDANNNDSALLEADILDTFADVGANMSHDVSMDQSTFSLRVLSDSTYSKKAIGLFSRIISQPTFPQDIIERDKKRIVSVIREEMTRPASIAEKEFRQVIYPEHPYGKSPTVDTVQAIMRSDLLDFYNKYYHSDRAVITIVGKLTLPEAKQVSENLTKNLPTRESSHISMKDVAKTKPVDRYVPHTASQAHILIGMPALKRGDPDFFALIVGNYILGGGGFSSRLMNEVREKRGVSYSVYSYFSPMLQQGPFVIGLQTEKNQVDQALSVVRNTFAEYLKNGPSNEELKAAKSHLINSFSMKIDTNGKMLDMVSIIGYYHLPLNYLDTWTDKIRAITKQDIINAMQRKLSAEQLSTVVVGTDSIH